jgi:hypothetical protein
MEKTATEERAKMVRNDATNRTLCDHAAFAMLWATRPKLLVFMPVHPL